MTLLEQRQEQRLRLLLLSPAVVILAIAALTVLTAHRTGLPTREGALDTIMKLAPRPAVDVPVATILIDDDSAERLGGWPWPRSALGALVDAAEEAGAVSVNLTISQVGEDPLSPDVVARRWMAVPGFADFGGVEALPSNDILLARAIAGGPVSLAVHGSVPGTGNDPDWATTTLLRSPWLRADGFRDAKRELSLPGAERKSDLAAELTEARVLSIGGLRRDPDGVVRHVVPLFATPEGPAATPGIAALAASGEPIAVTLQSGLLSNAPPSPRSLQVGASTVLPLTARSEFRLWMPKDAAVPAVSAWRVLNDPEAWTASLEGSHVFIGETQSRNGIVRTGRGPMTAARVHALIAKQAVYGEAPARPLWAGFAEAGASIILGAVAVLGVIFLPPILGFIGTILVAVLAFSGSFALFRSTGMLLDPSPTMLASFAGPSAVGLTVLANMIVRDDRVRGAFHGALPSAVMQRVQRQGGRRLLAGVHRDVTVLSCALNLPEALVERFKNDPEAFMEFRASANDRLRRTILDHEGTVDYGEDGRLLAYWNVPLDEPKHVEQACSCALKMLDDVSAMSQQVSEGHHLSSGAAVGELADARVEIGIATGPCFAGPVGMGGRNRYAALGMPVRFAGRLRGRSELYGPAILTDARVFDTLRHHYAFLDLDIVRRTAESDPEVIYGLVGNPFLKASKTFRDLAEVQKSLLDAWREHDLSTATRQLQKLRGIPGVPQPYVELFEKRIMAARLAKARRGSDYADVLGL
ncbi:MAG: adenylate/guanylate cyclase domain-containing protein [Pseudomonadota bacterium]